MGFQSAREIHRDARIERSISAFQDVDRPAQWSISQQGGVLIYPVSKISFVLRA
jgi:hypothetical protein